jgi:hypothetical protein
LDEGKTNEATNTNVNKISKSRQQSLVAASKPRNRKTIWLSLRRAGKGNRVPGIIRAADGASLRAAGLVFFV